MKKRDKANIERLGLIAAWMVAAAFAVSFATGVRWPFPAASDPLPALPLRQAPDPGAAGDGQIEVLNGSWRDGMARAALDQLRAAGFDVVSIGTLTLAAPADTSVVLDRVGNPELARAVAQRLGIRQIRSEPDSIALVDVTVLIGTDWEPGRSK